MDNHATEPRLWAVGLSLTMEHAPAASQRLCSLSGNPSNLVRSRKGSEVQSSESSKNLESGDELPRYTYQPLEEGYMRVLVLEPGTFGTPLSGELVPVRIPSEGYDDDDDEHDKNTDDEGYDDYWDDEDYESNEDNEDYEENEEYEDYEDDESDEDEEESSPSAQYEAISYAWGSAEPSHHITMNGGGVLGITLSLYQALQRFRYDHRQRILWADAVCINQNDKLEKSSQVAQMGQIYTLAQQTLIWLGESAGLDWLAFGVFAVIDDHYHEECERQMSVEDFGCALFDLRQSCLCCPAVPIDNASVAMQLASKAIETLFNRPWFFRLWVVQEYTLSKSNILHCGPHSHDPSACCFWLWNRHCDYGTDVPQPFSSATIAAINRGLPGGVKDARHSADSPLPDLLRSTAFRVCTDARDRIFAIKGLCEAHTWLEAVPDYDIEPRTLFAQIVSKCLIDGGESAPPRYHHASVLIALAPATKISHEELHDLPSWVPNLQCLDHDSCRFIWQRYMIWATIRFQGSLGRIPLELRMYGIMCGAVMHTLQGSQVELVGSIADDPNFFGDLTVFSNRESLCDWLWRCGKFTLEHNDINRMGKAFATALRKQDYEDTIEILIALEAAGREDLSDKQLEIVEACFGDREIYGRQLSSKIGPGRLFSVIQTDTFPQFGWVPADSQQGDELWVLKGCVWPFVLRRIPESDAYQIIGDASFPHLFAIHKDSKYEEQNVVYIR